VALGPACAQAALAKPQNVVYLPCSVSALSTAISSASSGDIVNLAPGCTYELTAALPNITTDLVIVGDGATLERSYAPGTPDFSILTVTGGNLTLIGVDFRNGLCHHGAAIYNDGGNVTVRGGTFIGNRALNYGGAIDNYSGYLTVSRARFIGNSTSGDGGSGGAIYNYDHMTVTGSDFIRNRAEWGGAIYNEYSATLNGGSYAWNYAHSGGGLYNDDDATVNGGTFGQNHADYGAGIYNNDTLTLWHTLITFNIASNQGGGIYNYGTLTANYSHIIANQAPGGGGGIYNYDDSTVTLHATVVFVNVPDNCEPLGTIAGCVG
jgi:hypothetical protein